VLEIEFIGDGNSYSLQRNYNGIKVTGSKFPKEKTYWVDQRKTNGPSNGGLREGGKRWRETDKEKLLKSKTY